MVRLGSLLVLFCMMLPSRGSAQVGDISGSVGIFINSYTFTEATSFFSIGGTVQARFNLSEKTQIGGQIGVYAGSSSEVFSLGLDLVETRVIDIPILATINFKIGNPDSWHGVIGARAGGYYETTKLELLGEEFYSESKFLPAVGVEAGFQVPVTDQLFILARTGVDFLFIEEEVIDGETFEAEVATVIPASIGLGFKF